MRRLGASDCLILLVLGTAGVRLSAAECDALDLVRTQWQSTRELLLRIAEAVPEEKYDYRPTPEVRSFREQLIHLTTDTYRHMGYAASQRRDDLDQFNSLKTRAEILEALNESLDYGTKVLTDLNDQTAMEIVTGMRGEKMTRTAAALSTIVDLMDHYGNLVVYLRLNGIVPPATASRQQQRR